jgi:hypothetical protein
VALYGKGAGNAVKAWEQFALAFEQFPFSNPLVYSSVVQYGPAHPLYFTPTGQSPRLLNSHDNLGWTQPFGPEITSRIFERMATDWKVGIRLLDQAMANVPEEKRLEVQRDRNLAEAVFLYWKSIANQIRFHDLRNRLNAQPALMARLKSLVKEEIELALRFLQVCRSDSRIGFEASLQYFYLPLDIQEKVAACRFMQTRQIPEAETTLLRKYKRKP